MIQTFFGSHEDRLDCNYFYRVIYHKSRRFFNWFTSFKPRQPFFQLLLCVGICNHKYDRYSTAYLVMLDDDTKKCFPDLTIQSIESVVCAIKLLKRLISPEIFNLAARAESKKKIYRFSTWYSATSLKVAITPSSRLKSPCFSKLFEQLSYSRAIFWRYFWRKILKSGLLFRRLSDTSTRIFKISCKFRISYYYCLFGPNIIQSSPVNSRCFEFFEPIPDIQRHTWQYIIPSLLAFKCRNCRFRTNLFPPYVPLNNQLAGMGERISEF